MLEYLIIFGLTVIAFAFLIFVLAAKNSSGHEAPASGCCGGQKEKGRCGHCSEFEDNRVF